jgi:predicted secreted protein
MKSVVLLTAIYFVVWWIVLFVVLPWGVKSQDETGEITQGTDPGAPARPLLLRKAIATTIISALLLAAGYGLWTTGLINSDFLPGGLIPPRH